MMHSTASLTYFSSLCFKFYILQVVC